MSAQQMIEHLEHGVLVSLGEPEAEKCFTPDENLEKWQDSLYNHRKNAERFSGSFLS